MTYGVIYADPPWEMDDLKPYLRRYEEEHAYYQGEQLLADDCVLLMWVTDPFLEKGFEVIKAWGFTYKTVGFYWAKTLYPAGDDDPILPGHFPIGTGYWTRANPEQCLLATRGRPKRVNADVRKLIVAPRREHRRKPDEAYERIERLCSGPYLELFARTARPGWDSWGSGLGIEQRKWASNSGPVSAPRPAHTS